MSPPPRIGICTDSSAQLPASLVERFDVEVVPLTVAVDGADHLEGVDIDADGFHAGHDPARMPLVDVVAPSPGQFAAAFEHLVERGCNGILSVHGATSLPSTLTAARLAARSMHVPVRVVDARLGGFGLGCAVWLAADVLAGGGSLDDAAAAAEQAAPRVGNVFVARPAHHHAHCADTVTMPVLTMRCDGVEVLERLEHAAEAVTAMASFALGWGDRLRVGVGHADPHSEPVADALEAALEAAANVLEVVRFRFGPSTAGHTSPCTVGCYMLRA